MAIVLLYRHLGGWGANHRSHITLKTSIALQALFIFASSEFVLPRHGFFSSALPSATSLFFVSGL
jgi:hypothetical protein